MMDDRLVVVKPFNTVNRRFQVAQVITTADLIDDQMPFEDRRRRFVTGFGTKAAAKAAVKVNQEGPILPDSPAPSPAPEPEEPAPVAEFPAEPEIKRPPRADNTF